MSNFGNMILDNKAQNLLIRSSTFLIARFMNKRLDKKTRYLRQTLFS